jgi:hypothetical protein
MGKAKSKVKVIAVKAGGKKKKVHRADFKNKPEPSTYRYPEPETTHRWYSKNDTFFIEMCDNAGVEATPRQHSKYMLKKGSAYKFKMSGLAN